MNQACSLIYLFLYNTNVSNVLCDPVIFIIFASLRNLSGIQV